MCTYLMWTALPDAFCFAAAWAASGPLPRWFNRRMVTNGVMHALPASEAPPHLARGLSDAVL